RSGLNTSQIAGELFDENIYATVGIVTTLIATLAFVSFYYIINSPKFNKSIHWFWMLLVTGVISTIFAIFHPKVKFDFLDYEVYFSDYLPFAVTVLIYSVLLFVLLSIVGKRWSSNCSVTPF
ncbi:MAG: hypothetical protein AAFO82_04715, partial [Bacteroidota bacterium]